MSIRPKLLLATGIFLIASAFSNLKAQTFEEKLNALYSAYNSIVVTSPTAMSTWEALNVQHNELINSATPEESQLYMNQITMLGLKRMHVYRQIQWANQGMLLVRNRMGLVEAP